MSPTVEADRRAVLNDCSHGSCGEVRRCLPTVPGSTSCPPNLSRSRGLEVRREGLAYGRHVNRTLCLDQQFGEPLRPQDLHTAG